MHKSFYNIYSFLLNFLSKHIIKKQQKCQHCSSPPQCSEDRDNQRCRWKHLPSASCDLSVGHILFVQKCSFIFSSSADDFISRHVQTAVVVDWNILATRGWVLLLWCYFQKTFTLLKTCDCGMGVFGGNLSNGRGIGRSIVLSVSFHLEFRW